MRTWNVRDEWIHKAEEMPFKELREHIKELKQKRRIKHRPERGLY